MTIQIKDMEKYGTFTHKMLVDEIYVLKTRLALCKLDNKTMHARYESKIKSEVIKAKKETTDAITATMEKLEPKVTCPKCLGIVTMKSTIIKEVATGKTLRFAKCPICNTIHSEKDVQDVTTKQALNQAAQTDCSKNTVSLSSAPVDIAEVEDKLIGRFGLKHE